MPTNSVTVPNPKDVKRFPKNKKAKIVVETRTGRLRVVIRNYYWDKEKGRGCEHREYLGYIVNNVYYSNEEYHEKFNKFGRPRLMPGKKTAPSKSKPAAPVPVTPPAMKSLLAAEFPVYHAVAEESGLLEDLTATWGETAARFILSLAFHWLHTSSNATYLYKSWCGGKLLPYPHSVDSKEISGFFQEIAEFPGWQEKFFGARIARLPEDEMLSYDATKIASEAAEISYAQYGFGKEGGYQKQVGLILLVGHKTSMPVLFRVLPGQIADVTTVQDMLFRFNEVTEKKRVLAAVVDRGYFSLSNIARFIGAGSNVIMAAKTDSTWVSDAIEKAMTQAWDVKNYIGRDIYGVTVPCSPKFGDGKERTVWAQVFRSDEKSAREHFAFDSALVDFESRWNHWQPEHHKPGQSSLLEKSPLLQYYKTPAGQPGSSKLERDLEKIEATVRHFGFFCHVTTQEMTPADTYAAYRSRDIIEKAFKSGKTDFNLDAARAHTESTLTGRFIVSFVALTILMDIRRRMNRRTFTYKGPEPIVDRPLSDEMTFNELKNYLGSIRIATGSDGASHWEEITKRQLDISRRLGFPNLYQTPPSWMES